MANIDDDVVTGFGDEWTRFDQSGLPEDEAETIFESYFRVFPWEKLPANAVGFDAGCGSGRWARFVAPRVHTLHCVEPSRAIEVARRNLSKHSNVVFHHVDIDGMPIEDASMDFGYSLGVLHHIPDTAAAMAKCVAKVKPGGWFLVYLYYAFDNRPAWFRGVWKVSELGRNFVSSLPSRPRGWAADVMATGVYLPLARLALLADKAGFDVANVPLSAYRDRSFYTMRTDALDRFGTKLEQRFTLEQIVEMMRVAGCDEVVSSPQSPYWCVAGRRAMSEWL